MAPNEKTPEYTKPALYVGTLIVSIVGLILTLTDGLLDGMMDIMK